MVNFIALLAALSKLEDKLRDALTRIESVWTVSHEAAEFFSDEQPTSLYITAMHGGLAATALTEEEKTARDEFVLTAINLGFGPEKSNALAFVLHAACNPKCVEAECVAAVLSPLFNQRSRLGSNE